MEEPQEGFFSFADPDQGRRSILKTFRKISNSHNLEKWFAGSLYFNYRYVSSILKTCICIPEFEST
jgi:hypothetical protein